MNILIIVKVGGGGESDLVKWRMDLPNYVDYDVYNG